LVRLIAPAARALAMLALWSSEKRGPYKQSAPRHASAQLIGSLKDCKACSRASTNQSMKHQTID
jgi:hypothetical protein